MTDFRITIDPLPGSKQRGLIEIDSERGAVSHAFMLKNDEMVFWTAISEEEAEPKLVDLVKMIIELF